MTYNDSVVQFSSEWTHERYIIDIMRLMRAKYLNTSYLKLLSYEINQLGFFIHVFWARIKHELTSLFFICILCSKKYILAYGFEHKRAITFDVYIFSGSVFISRC